MNKLVELDKELSKRLKTLQALFDSGGTISSMEGFKYYAQIYFDMGYEWGRKEGSD